MPYHDWQRTAVDILEERIGSAANIVVDDIASAMALNNQTMNRAEYTCLLMSLCKVLPGPINSIK